MSDSKGASAFKKRMTRKKRELLREGLHIALDKIITSMLRKPDSQWRHGIILPSTTLNDHFLISLHREERLPPGSLCE